MNTKVYVENDNTKQKGYIYLLTNDNGEKYFGSTDNLTHRYCKHIYDYKLYLLNKQPKNLSSFKIFDSDFKTTRMEKLADVYYENDTYLREIEQRYIDLFPECVNDRDAYLTKEAYLEKHKHYNKMHKEKYKDKMNISHPCVCGGSYLQRHKSSHVNTTKHQTYINSQKPQQVINLNF